MAERIRTAEGLSFDVDTFKDGRVCRANAAPILVEDVDRGVIRDGEATGEADAWFMSAVSRPVISPSPAAVWRPAPSSRPSSVPTWDAVCVRDWPAEV